jgi:flavin reductase (DIM6/NTAB) family NADH-FMN oxidoreductase RutF
MVYETVAYTSYLKETLELLDEPGLLLVAAGADGKPNAMTIGWGAVGPIWGKNIFTVLVRPSRYTYTLLNESDSFTVCLPAPDMRAAVDYCGQYSGRDGDKLAACHLSTIPSTKVSAPGIAGCPVIYECRIVHYNEVNPATLAKDISAYPKGNYHRIYSGEIMAVRALANAAALLGRA